MQNKNKVKKNKLSPNKNWLKDKRNMGLNHHQPWEAWGEGEEHAGGEEGGRRGGGASWCFDQACRREEVCL